MSGFIILTLINIQEVNANSVVLEDIYYSKNLNDKDKLDSIFNHFFQKEIPQKQITTANKLKILAESENNLLWLYRAYYLIGNAYFYMADLEKANDYCLKSLKIAEKEGYKEGIDIIYNSLASIYSINEDHERAILYFYNSYSKLIQSTDSLNAGYTLLNIVNEYNLLELEDSILHYLDLAESIFIKIDDDYGKAYVHGQKAIFYTNIGKTELAENYFDTCIVLLTDIGQIYDIVAFQIEMAKVLQKQKKPELALNYTLACYTSAKEAGLNEQLRDASELLAELYSKFGNYTQAFRYQTEYINYKDSINNEETIRKMADLRAEYEISQKQVEVDYLEGKRKVNRIILISVIAIGLVFIVLAYYLHKTNRLIRKQRLRLVKQKNDLEKLNDTKDKMFSIVSHDLRGPIHSITGFTSLMEEVIESEDTKTLLELSSQMNSSMNYISSLLDNLLEWASNQQGQIPHHPSQLNVYDIIKSQQEIFVQAAKTKGVEIFVDIPTDQKVFADKNTFSTIFRNLIGNAIKYTNKGDKITISTQNTARKTVIVVEDTGIGIAKEKLPELFTLSNKKSTFGTAREKGIGLGLRLAKEFTELNKGKIWVESEEGKGTRFMVEFQKNE